MTRQEEMSSYCARGCLDWILGKIFFTQRAAKHWNRLTTKVEQAMCLEEFKRHVDVVLRDILLKGLEQKCHKTLQAQRAGSAALKSKMHGRLVLKERVCCLLSEPHVSAAFFSTIYFVCNRGSRTAILAECRASQPPMGCCSEGQGQKG